MGRITAVESLLVFLVDVYRSLFLCFIELLVRGSLSLLISAVEAMSSVVHDTAQSIQAGIQASIEAINATLRGSLGAMNDVLKLIGQHMTVPVVPTPDLTCADGGKTGK